LHRLRATPRRRYRAKVFAEAVTLIADHIEGQDRRLTKLKDRVADGHAMDWEGCVRW